MDVSSQRTFLPFIHSPAEPVRSRVNIEANTAFAVKLLDCYDNTAYSAARIASASGGATCDTRPGSPSDQCSCEESAPSSPSAVQAWTTTTSVHTASPAAGLTTTLATALPASTTQVYCKPKPNNSNHGGGNGQSNGNNGGGEGGGGGGRESQACSWSLMHPFSMRVLTRLCFCRSLLHWRRRLGERSCETVAASVAAQGLDFNDAAREQQPAGWR